MNYEIICKNKKIINVILDYGLKKGSEFNWNNTKYKVLDISIKDPDNLISIKCKEVKESKRKFLSSKPRTTI